MRLLLLSILFTCCLPTISYTQTGPAGVGNSNNNILWLDVSQLNVPDSTQLSSWLDISGNNNHVWQTNSTNTPIFVSNQINGFPAIKFDGSNDFYNFSDNITAGDISVFTVYLSSKISSGALLQTDKHVLLTDNNRLSAFYKNPNKRYIIPKNNGTFSVSSMQTDGTISNSLLFLSNGSSTTNYTRNDLSSNHTSYLGKYINLHFQGAIAEIIIYNEVLNSAKRKIISNHLAAKYNLIAEQNLYTYKTNYGHDVKGIGQEVDGNHLLAKGSDSLTISNPSAMDDGEYVMVGSNNAGYSTTTATGPRAVNRWSQVWRVDKTGDPGTVDLEFFLGGNGFTTPSNYIVLIETADGDFTNGGTSIHEFGRQYNSARNSISFTNVNLPDGAYFTLAEQNAPISSVADGNWSSFATWNCDCIPGIDDVVINQHNLTIQSNQSVLDLSIESGGSINFVGSDTLFVYGDMNINGAINSGTGTIAAVNQSIEQVFVNNSGSSIGFYNLYVNNSSGLNLTTGSWGITNSLQVSSGGINTINAKDVTLISNSTNTAQILPSMDNAFNGDFILQRYIGPRSAGWADLSSPVENTTVGDLDDDLYISGVNGNDGNATFENGTIFYTMFTYDHVIDKHDTITSTSTILAPGKGYEIWLADNSTSFFGKVVNFHGNPNNGNYSAIVNQGWNFVGNPYQSFIAYDSIKKSSWVPDSYYIWNTNNGSYDYFTGSGKPPIAPGQGFWIHKITVSNLLFEFDENIKVNSNSSSFLRQKIDDEFSLDIKSSVVPYRHKMELDFSSSSSDKLDEKDAFYLKSKLEEAPAITTHASDSEKELIYSSLNPLESSQQIPISIYAGLEGEYQIQAENLSSLKQYYNCVFLVDKFKNTSIDLSAHPTYTFEAKKGKSDRFELILSNSYQDCQSIVDKEARQQLDSKFSLRKSNGVWYLDYNFIEKNSQVEIQLFNLTGQKVRKTESFKASSSGSYQLQSLEGLNGLFLAQVKGKDSFLNKIINL